MGRIFPRPEHRVTSRCGTRMEPCCGVGDRPPGCCQSVATPVRAPGWTLRKTVGLQRFRQADERIRTADPFITSEVLYQLSYVGAGWIVAAHPVPPPRHHPARCRARDV